MSRHTHAHTYALKYTCILSRHVCIYAYLISINEANNSTVGIIALSPWVRLVPEVRVVRHFLVDQVSSKHKHQSTLCLTDHTYYLIDPNTNKQNCGTYACTLGPICFCLLIIFCVCQYASHLNKRKLCSACVNEIFIVTNTNSFVRTIIVTTACKCNGETRVP